MVEIKNMTIFISLSNNLGTFILVLGCFPFESGPYQSLSDYFSFSYDFSRLDTIDRISFSPNKTKSTISSAVLSKKLEKCSTNIVFAENQLFPSSIGFSPLTTNHWCPLQRTTIQSITCS